MTNTPKPDDPIVVVDASGQPQMNRAATELLFGCPILTADPTNLPQSVIDAGRRRRQQYIDRIGHPDPTLLAVIAHHARHDGVRLWETRDGVTYRDITDYTDPLPDTVVVTGKDGLPGAVVDLDQHTADATKFMYALAQTAGDDAATTRVFEQWHTAHPSDDGHEFSMLCATTLSFLVRHILGPTLDACDAAGLPLRAGLKRAATQEL